MTRLCVAAMGAVAISCFATFAAAQPRDSAAAEALFNEARRLAEAGRYAEACPKFAESNRLDPGVGVLMYLGACHERLGRVASAWAAFREARDGAELQGRADRVATADERIRALEPRLPKLRIDVPPDATIAGLTITRGEIPVNEATWRTPIPVDPGTHVVVASAPGYERWEATVEAREGELSKLEVPLLRLESGDPTAVAPVPAPAAPPRGTDAKQARTEADSVGSGQRIGAGIALGVGGASLVAGTIFGLVASSSWSSAQDACRPGTPLRCTPEGLSDIDSAESAGLASTIFFIAGGAGVAAGAVLWLTAPSGEGPTAALRLDVGGVHANGTF